MKSFKIRFISQLTLFDYNRKYDNGKSKSTSEEFMYKRYILTALHSKHTWQMVGINILVGEIVRLHDLLNNRPFVARLNGVEFI